MVEMGLIRDLGSKRLLREEELRMRQIWSEMLVVRRYTILVADSKLLPRIVLLTVRLMLHLKRMLLKLLLIILTSSKESLNLSPVTKLNLLLI